MKKKIKIAPSGFLCPCCSSYLRESYYKRKTVLRCYSSNCQLNDTIYKLPQVEIEEYEIKDGKEPDRADTKEN